MLEDVFSPVLPGDSLYKIKQLDKDSGVVFSANVKSDARLVWTLREILATDRTYITASTFFARKRQRRYVRHVLALVCDFDTPAGTTWEDILDCYHAASLPSPELIVATATPGHYQAWNIFEKPVRIKHDIILAKISRVHEMMVETLGADICAVGVERWVRRPCPDNIVYFDAFSRTSWTELAAWYDARRVPRVQPGAKKKVVYIGTLLATPAGQRIQEPAAERGYRNEWAYGLGLCLFDAGISREVIHDTLHNWNKAIEEPLPVADIEKIYRSVMTGRHHASPRVLEMLTGRSARIKGWYKWAKPRDRRRDHLQEVRQDIISDLMVHEEVIETQKAWAERLGVSYRTLKKVLAMLRQEGIIDAIVGHGRFAQSTYRLSQTFLDSITSPDLLAAAGAEGAIFRALPIGHTANSPLMGTLPSLGRMRGGVVDSS